jgi:hypothetical protein
MLRHGFPASFGLKGAPAKYTKLVGQWRDLHGVIGSERRRRYGPVQRNPRRACGGHPVCGGAARNDRPIAAESGAPEPKPPASTTWMPTSTAVAAPTVPLPSMYSTPPFNASRSAAPLTTSSPELKVAPDARRGILRRSTGHDVFDVVALGGRPADRRRSQPAHRTQCRPPVHRGPRRRLRRRGAADFHYILLPPPQDSSAALTVRGTDILTVSHNMSTLLNPVAASHHRVGAAVGRKPVDVDLR